MSQAKKKNQVIPSPREPNNRHQRPTAAEREEARLKKLHAERYTVLNQPHRRMNIDQRCENALGRFVIHKRLHPALYDAGQEYAAIVMSYRRLIGLPGVLSNGPGAGHRCDDPDISEKIERLRIRKRDAFSAMRASDARDTHRLCVDMPPFEDIDLRDDALCIRIAWGLKALAVHFGMMPRGR